MKTKRLYTMRARAQAAQETERRILEAVAALFWEKPVHRITLDEVAARAGVSVQTLLRHFASRESLLQKAHGRIRDAVMQERAAPPGDVGRAVEAVVEHYEKRGDSVLLLLAQETWDGDLEQFTESGRRAHRDWVERVFETADPALVDLLVVATDVYTWKLLRRDRGLSRRDTETRIRRLVDALLGGEPDA
jgi:AcrR family transcriptional regulator